ncbi:hypothetical protein ACFFQF_01435 [Haladaptatus pallidirubidus]|uniref:Uncharacterized protein n=1 Tax=Haladaptatus pallidirubidus TaxID=1008152 RepID=A0AAV3UBL2_9EURY|nr:hypothetical protein [Haladaptatus pallidirubidus]
MSSDEFEGDLRTTYVAAIGSVVESHDDDLVLGVIRYKYDFFERTVDRNCPALAPPRKLLNQFKKVEKAAESDGVHVYIGLLR